MHRRSSGKSREKVLVFEKDGNICGRAKSIIYNGQIIDDGAHVPTRPGHLERIFSDLGHKYPELILIGNSEIYHNNKWVNARELYSGDMFKKVMNKILTIPEEKLAGLDDIPLDDWVESILDAPGLKDVFFYLACSTSVGNRIETYSAGEMSYIIR